MPSTDSSPESSQKSTLQKQLYVHEWLAVSVMAGFLMMLTLIVICKGHNNFILTDKGGAKLHYLKPQTVDLYIGGAVANPGSYRVKAGTLLKDVVAMAEPLPEADLRKIRPKSPARNGQSYLVQTRPTITVSVSGAVEVKGSHTIPKGTRLCDLGSYIALKPTADLEKIQRKRFLKDNEEVIIQELK